jgi:hypothetical protein
LQLLPKLIGLNNGSAIIPSGVSYVMNNIRLRQPGGSGATG